MRTNASNVAADTSAQGDVHGALSLRVQSLPCLPFLKVNLCVEERGRIGTPGHYRRIFATCQEHCESGAAPGRIRQNTGSRQTATLGSNGPLAYLGAWLIAGRAIATREEHVAFKHTDLQTREYAESKNLT